MTNNNDKTRLETAKKLARAFHSAHTDETILAILSTHDAEVERRARLDEVNEFNVFFQNVRVGVYGHGWGEKLEAVIKKRIRQLEAEGKRD